MAINKSSGTIQAPARYPIRNITPENLNIGFTNGSSGDMQPGQEVILKTDGSVDLRTAGTQKPIGVVIKGAATGQKVVVATMFFIEMEVVADSTAGIAVGDSVVMTGALDVDGMPIVTKALSTDYKMNIALQAGTSAATQFKIGVLGGLFK